MCGICGNINFDNTPAREISLSSMMAGMKHRGPDDEGIFIESNVGLGFVRLSIIDLSPAGNQPMFSASKRYVIVFNGEIFNYIELRKELIAKGHSFNTKTDTEVLLTSYIEWGPECVNKFNGMWAFGIYDRKERKFFASRDRYGIKPFYYYLDEEIFAFASEIPPLLNSMTGKPVPDYQAIFDYLFSNRTDHSEFTFFENIKKLQHGCNLFIDIQQTSVNKTGHQKLIIKRWYDLREQVLNAEPFNSTDEFRELLSSAIGLRLRSDVPVGVCLSGGLDSSTLVSLLLKDFGKQDLNTFSAIFKENQELDESKYIDKYAESVKNMHYTTPDADSLFSDIDNLVRALGEPIPSTGPYAQFKVMELARDNVVVTLDGQGADELLAGYHYFFGYYFKDLLKHGKLFRLTNEVVHYIANQKSSYGLQTFLYFLLPQAMRTNTRIREKGYINPDFVAEYSKTSDISRTIYGSGSLQDALMDHFEYKLEHLLKWEDRNSMWFSLEARVPFLDYRLVEKTLALPSDQIIHKGMTKSILREATSGIIPETIRMRKDKIGFITPEAEWFRKEMFQKLVTEVLESDVFRNNKLIDVEKSKSVYRKHVNGKLDISKEIWKWIHLERWFRKFIQV